MKNQLVKENSRLAYNPSINHTTRMSISSRCTTTFSFVAVLFLSLLGSFAASSQGIPCPSQSASMASAGQDTTICPNSCATLSATSFSTVKSTLTYAATPITYNPDSYTAGLTVPVTGDDSYSSVIPIGFSFCFFGNAYTSCIVSVNGTVSFNIANANNNSGYTVPGPIPMNYLPYNNSILAPYHDLNPVPPNGGTITYQVLGTAPCRRFVVSWNMVKLFGPCSIVTATQQATLYESTNVIDINIGNKPLCTGWINGLAVLGIQNATATVAYSFPGRNAVQWQETNAAYRFTPNAAPIVSYQWRNLTTNAIVGTTQSINACATDTTEYELVVKYSSLCDSTILKDTVRVNVNNSVLAGYTYDVKYGCNADTVSFTNTSLGATRYEWSFGDGSFDTATNPTHVYRNQGIYDARLIVDNGTCKDTFIQSINLVHPLDAKFTVSQDSACQQETIVFTNTSDATSRLGIDPSYKWYFMDGTTDTARSPIHTFTRPGIYKVFMVVTDFVPCVDTAFRTIVIDSLAFTRIMVSDTISCEGKVINFQGDFLSMGNIGYQWSFGDGTIINNVNPISHAYDSVGTYKVKLSTFYRICPEDSASRTIVITPSPTINLGPDTVLCPGNAPIKIYDRNEQGNLANSYLWSNGDSTVRFILARDQGTYWATVTQRNCKATDSITVLKDCFIDVPNAFSPNGDGDNDYFFPRQLLSSNLTKFYMAVYNRWGQKVFETRSQNGRGWDGRFNGAIQPAGVYIYQIEAEFLNRGSEKYTGNVTLLR